MDKKKKEYEYGTLEYAEGIGKQYADMNYDSFKQGEEYSGLKKGYEQSGQKAMKDTIAQMAAKTGGMASSYAQTAGQQAYGDWMTRLEDAAYSMYGAQKDDLLNQYNLAKDAYSTRKALSDEEAAKNKENLMNLFAIGNTLDTSNYADLGISDEDATAYWNEYQAGRQGEGADRFYNDLVSGAIKADSDTVENLASKYGISVDGVNNTISKFKAETIPEQKEKDKTTATESLYLKFAMDENLTPETLSKEDKEALEALGIDITAVYNRASLDMKGERADAAELARINQEAVASQGLADFETDLYLGLITIGDGEGKVKLDENLLSQYNLTADQMKAAQRIVKAYNNATTEQSEAKSAALKEDNKNRLMVKIILGDIPMEEAVSKAGDFGLKEEDVNEVIDEIRLANASGSEEYPLMSIDDIIKINTFTNGAGESDVDMLGVWEMMFALGYVDQTMMDRMGITEALNWKNK